MTMMMMMMMIMMMMMMCSDLVHALEELLEVRLDHHRVLGLPQDLQQVVVPDEVEPASTVIIIIILLLLLLLVIAIALPYHVILYIWIIPVD
jgi:hypothetical protein